MPVGPETEIPVTVPTVKPGKKTSEFLLSVLPVVAGIGLVIYGIIEANDVAIAAGAVMSGVPVVGYSASRAKVKAAAPEQEGS